MATTPTRASATEGLLHWLVAGPTLALLASGAVLYAPALSEAVGLRFWVRGLHLSAAVAVVLAPAALALARRREALAVERELLVWDDADRTWFTRPVRVLFGWGGRLSAAPTASRFNGGQRLLAALTAGGLVALLLTGVPMYWWGWFAADLVGRARDVHVLAAFGLTALVLGHVYLALGSQRGTRRR